MPRVGPLAKGAASNTLANRLGPRIDRLRQLETRFGLRSVRTFLVWVAWSGTEQGSGTEKVLAEIELLPTPKVPNFDAQQWQAKSGGRLPEGQVVIQEISLSYDRELLTGRRVPNNAKSDGTPIYDVRTQVEFFYELRDDDRSSPPTGAQASGDHQSHPLVRRSRFRPLGEPARREGFVSWSVLVERASQDRNPDGTLDDWNVNT
jgi:hypothetical protein